MIRLVANKLDFTQNELKRKAIRTLIVLWVLWLIVTRRLTLQKIKKLWRMLKMVF